MTRVVLLTKQPGHLHLVHDQVITCGWFETYICGAPHMLDSHTSMNVSNRLLSLLSCLNS